MDTRRSVLKKLAVGGVTAAAVPATGVAAFETGKALAAGQLPTGPAPWWLFAPVGLGSPLSFGWYIAGLSPVVDGASVLTLAHASGRKAEVHVCAHGGQPTGLASTQLVDMVLMDGGTGSARTDELLGRVILGLADRVRSNETNPEGDLFPIARMMTHDQRVEAFGPDALG